MATNVLDAVLAQYEQSTQSSTNSNSKMSSEDRMKKYFAALLKDNEKQGQRRVRILPTTDGSSPFKEVWFHEILVDGKWQKFYDPGKNDNERSPLNEVYEELMSTGKETDKQLAAQYRARKFYIVKVIDRDNEQDGVKFWRFKHNYKQEGILDKIIPIWKAKGDITDPDKGRDLILELTKAKTPKGATYTVIQTVMYDDPSPISEDETQMSEWVADELTWEDVYSKKPVEYLEAIARGETPRWDSEKGGYVYSNDEVGEVSMGGTLKMEVKSINEVADPQANDEIDEELPF
jgi:gp32 DNA binding protein like